MSKPSVLVLMATYNGSKWLEFQIKTILSQDNINIKLLVADDVSTDTTEVILKKYAEFDNFNYYKNKKNLGPCLNFIKLILNADLEKIDFIALSDQDDLWLSDKLVRAIELIKKNGCDGYSSGFYITKDSYKIKFRKKVKQTKYDYIFESPGPGCTYVLTSNSIKELKEFLRKNYDSLGKVKFHDWLIYFWYRVNDKKWIIDNESKIEYRQHDNNYFGANSGFSKKMQRAKMMLNSWYINQIKIMILICSNTIIDEDFMQRNKLTISRIFQISKNSRRCVSERPIIFIYLLLYKYKIIG